MKRHGILITVVAVLFSFFTVASYVAEAAEQPIRVLIVDDKSPGYYADMHTEVTLRNIIRQDKRFQVTLVETAEVLGTDLPFDYDVLLLHFKNYIEPKRNAAMQTNLENFVTEGGGLFVFHFACGAFEDWAGYEKLAGRIWDPQKRAHDDYRRFTVKIVDEEHPITRNIDDFEIQDELYTCLNDSEVPIRVLAEAVSNVDGKTYPMAFVLENGKGRTFHTTLGHDDRSLSARGFQKMIREALVWCAQRENFARTSDVMTVQFLDEDTEDSAGAVAGELSARLKEIRNTLPEGARLLAYFDCGGRATFRVHGGRSLPHIVAPADAKTWTFRPDAPIEGVPPQHFTVLFDDKQLPFLIEGLDRSKRYQLNVVWWDFDANGRSQSLVVQSPDLSQVRILRAGVALPDFKESGLPAQTVTVPLPMAFVRDGKLVLNIRGESGANVVVSEIWINELPPLPEPQS